MLELHTVKRAVLILVTLLLISWGAFYFYQSYATRQAKKLAAQFNSAIALADTAHQRGDFDESIVSYQRALDLETSQSSAARAKTRLAYDLFFRNTGEDRREATVLYKEIIADASLDPRLRAAILNTFLNTVSRANSEELARNVVFQGEPLGAFLKDGNIREAMLNAYKYSFSIYPLANSAFNVAIRYGYRLQRNQSEMSAEEKSEAIDSLKSWTEKGESLLVESGLNSPAQRAYEHHLNGIARWQLGKYSSDLDNGAVASQYDQSEKAFQNALQILAPEDVLDTYRTGLYVRYTYALLLSERYGDGRRGEISKLLSSIISPPEQFRAHQKVFVDFLRNTRARSCVKDTPRLIELVPEFGKYLIANNAQCS